jgi:hypothetical protein
METLDETVFVDEKKVLIPPDTCSSEHTGIETCRRQAM